MTARGIRTGLLCMSAALVLSACAKPGDRTLFDGKYYPARVKKDRDDRRAFTVSVSRPDQGLAGAREAGRHAGTKYCVENYGSSEIVWKNDGPDAPREALIRTGRGLVFAGRCEEW